MGTAPSPRCVLFSVCKVLYLPPLRTQHPVQSGRADPSGANVAPWGERRLSIPRLQAWGVSKRLVAVRIAPPIISRRVWRGGGRRRRRGAGGGGGGRGRGGTPPPAARRARAPGRV